MVTAIRRFGPDSGILAWACAARTPAITALKASKEPLRPPMATLQLVGASTENIRAGDGMRALTGQAVFTRVPVGDITDNDYSTSFPVRRSLPAADFHKLRTGRPR